MELPWSASTTDHIDLAQARLDLDRDHYGLDKVKKRVLEFLAVRKLKNSLKGMFVCVCVCVCVCVYCSRLGPILVYVQSQVLSCALLVPPVLGKQA